MITDLKLSGNSLLVYAIIYGFSQDGMSKFTGSLQYLADWCNSSRNGIQKNLKELLDKGLITKTEWYENNVKHCAYGCTTELYRGVQLSCTDNNIDISNDISNISLDKSKDISNKNKNINNYNNPNNAEISEYDAHSYSHEELQADFLGSVPKQKTKRKSLYEKCKDEIYEYTQDEVLRHVLVNYLGVRLSIKDKPIYGVNQWKGLLNRLSKIDGDPIEIVELATEKGWCSFYPVKNNKNNFSEGDGLSCKQADVNTDELKQRLLNKGERAEF